MIDYQKIIAEVNGNMTMDVMPLTKKDKDRILVVLRGEVTAKEMVKRLVEKHL